MYKDKDFYKRKNDNISKLEQLKNRQIKITSAFLALLLSLQGTICLSTIKNGVEYELNNSNPFTGSTISSDFIANYQAVKTNEFICDDAFKDIVDKIRNSDMDEKKAYALYYALLQNEYLTKEEKEKLTGYIQYFIDNKYLDYEYVYNKLSSFKINSSDEALLDEGIAGLYNNYDNSITFANDNCRNNSISHEIFHAEEHYKGDNAWFFEGLTALLAYEYNDELISYDAEVTFCRILCEFVGSDILFETRAKGDINILVNALVNRGIEKEKVDELFALFNDYRWERKEENPDFDSLRIKIIDLLRDCYFDIIENEELINPMIYEHIKYISNINFTHCDSGIKYYFNSKKIEEIGIPKFYKKTFFQSANKNSDTTALDLDNMTIIREYYDNYIKVITKKSVNGVEETDIMAKEVSKDSFDNSINSIVNEIDNKKSSVTLI